MVGLSDAALLAHVTGILHFALSPPKISRGRLPWSMICTRSLSVVMDGIISCSASFLHREIESTLRTGTKGSILVATRHRLSVLWRQVVR